VIEDIGCQAMAVLFGGKGADSLAKMRYNNFSRNIVSASSFVTPERLPQARSVGGHTGAVPPLLHGCAPSALKREEKKYAQKN